MFSTLLKGQNAMIAGMDFELANDFKKAFKSKKRERCAPPAPACGLYLLNVKY